MTFKTAPKTVAPSAQFFNQLAHLSNNIKLSGFIEVYTSIILKMLSLIEGLFP